MKRLHSKSILIACTLHVNARLYWRRPSRNRLSPHDIDRLKTLFSSPLSQSYKLIWALPLYGYPQLEQDYLHKTGLQMEDCPQVLYLGQNVNRPCVGANCQQALYLGQNVNRSCVWGQLSTGAINRRYIWGKLWTCHVFGANCQQAMCLGQTVNRCA